MMLPDRKLRIAVLIRRFISTGGAERYALEVTRRLSVEHEVHVFAQEWSYTGKENITFHKIPRFFIKPSWLNQLLFSYFSRKAAGSFFDIIHSHEKVTQFDIMTVHSPCFRSFITQEGRRWKRILIWFSVLFSPRELAWLWLEKKEFAYKKGRLLIAVSENVKKNVMANYPLPDQYFRLAYPGVDPGMSHREGHEDEVEMLRSQLGIARDQIAILFVGTEFKRKGLEGLLRGFALMPYSNLKLVIAGEGGGKLEEFKNLARSLGIHDHVLFLGLVSEIHRFYRLADIYILPTLSDPFGMAPFEAMASGVATIMSSSDFAGSAEHIQCGEALLLRNPEDPKEIAASLLKLMDPDCRAKLGRRGQRLAAELTWEKTTANTLSAYNEVLRQKRSAAQYRLSGILAGVS